jgi:hypothetical protein
MLFVDDFGTRRSGGSQHELMAVIGLANKNALMKISSLDLFMARVRMW